jgi:hypothetical protein
MAWGQLPLSDRGCESRDWLNLPNGLYWRLTRLPKLEKNPVAYPEAHLAVVNFGRRDIFGAYAPACHVTAVCRCEVGPNTHVLSSIRSPMAIAPGHLTEGNYERRRYAVQAGTILGAEDLQGQFGRDK